MTKEEFSDLCSANNIIYLGELDDVDQLFLRQDFCLPSYREGLPRSTLEAMSMGRPIITTMSLVVGNSQEGLGFLVKPQCSYSLAFGINKLLSLASDDQLKMARFSRFMASEKFDVRVNSSMIHILLS